MNRGGRRGASLSRFHFGVSTPPATATLRIMMMQRKRRRGTEESDPGSAWMKGHTRGCIIHDETLFPRRIGRRRREWFPPPTRIIGQSQSSQESNDRCIIATITTTPNNNVHVFQCLPARRSPPLVAVLATCFVRFYD
jgi:hypothetical protein